MQSEAHPDSVLNRFNCGNLESLKQEGIREALLNFHKTWYSSNIMKLCVTGRHDIDKLEEMARQLFSQVADKEVKVPDLSKPAPYDERNLGHFYRFVPVKDKDILSFVWHLPCTEAEYKTQPLRYHSHLFGHEGENSLLSYLIAEGLALELSASHDHELNGAFSNLNIDISLTKKGLIEHERVIEALFQYAHIVKERGVQDYVFDEYKRVGELEFDFLDKSKPLNYCIRLASKMQKFDTNETLAELIRHSYVVESLDKPRVQEMSDLLVNPKNLNIYLRSKTFSEEPSLTPIEDRWYKTKYGKEAFNEKLLKIMTQPSVKITKKKLDLPPANNLLPKNLDVLPATVPPMEKPELMRQWADDTDLWYLKDDKYLRPKGMVSLKIYTGDCEFGRTPQGRVFVELWNAMLQEHLREFYYMAQMASLHASMSLPHDNYNIQWSGFSDSLPTFVEETLKRLRAFDVRKAEEYFD